MKIRIKHKTIGDNKPTFLVAEIGINHNGQKNIAKKLISKAKSAGADAVKFQTFKASDLAIPTSKYFPIFSKVEFNESDFAELSDHAKKEEIIFFSTPSSNDAVNFLNKINVPAFKISSGDLTNIPLIEYVASKNKPVILSTGMGTMEEITYAVKSIIKKGNKKIIILHSVSGYPTPIVEANLNVINTLKHQFPFPIGFSDNGKETDVAVVAVALGAKLIEKHFTLNKKMKGPDHKISADPTDFSNMVKKIRQVENMLGAGKKIIQNSESDNRIQARKSLIINQTTEKGTKITKKMISVMRPATGISPKELNNVIGKTTKKRIRIYESLKWKNLS